MARPQRDPADRLTAAPARRRPSVGAGPLLLYLLAGLYPAVFLASKNWYLFTGRQLASLVLLTAAATLTLGALLSRLGAAARSPRRRNLADTLFAGLLFVFLMQSVIFYRYDPAWFKVAAAAVGMAVVLGVVARAGLPILNVTLAIMVLLAAFDWVRSYRRSVKEVQSLSWNTVDRERIERLAFARTPNVYLVQLESYQSREAFRAVYGFDNGEFEDALAALGFTVFPGHFSNYSYTLASLGALFGMHHHYNRIAIGSSDALGVRDLIGGNSYNPVLRAFLRNGYRCQIVHPSDYAFIAGDDWEYVHPRRRLARAFTIYRSVALDRLLERGRRALRGSEDFEAILEDRLRAAAESPRPVFTYLAPPGIDHSPVDRTWNALDSWARGFPEQVRAASPRYLALARRIAERDPGAVIVLFGDHGAARYRGIGNDPARLAGELRAQGITARTLALDLFGTLLAIRDPGGDPRRFEGTSLVNLLRTLFAELAGDEALPGPRVEDDSYQTVDLRLYRVVRGGEPLDAWESADEPPGR